MRFWVRSQPRSTQTGVWAVKKCPRDLGVLCKATVFTITREQEDTTCLCVVHENSYSVGLQ